MMFKRFVARSLIFLQLYSTLFQGVAHANFTDNYPINHEIYLHGSVDKHGGMRLALGTDDVGQDPKVLKVFEITDYKTLRAQHSQIIKSPNYQLLKKKPLLDAEELDASFEQERERLSESSDRDSDDGYSTDDSLGIKRDGITSFPEGIDLTIQGLKVFMNTDGELLVHGTQTDFSKPIILCCKKSIVLNNVDASTLKLISPSILGVGHSTIDFLSLEGLSKTSVFINSGSLTAKELFLKNLDTTNSGVIEAKAFEAQAGILNNTGTLDVEAEIILGVDKFINSGTVTAGSIQGSESLAEFANTPNGKVFIDKLFRTSETTTVINDGSIEGRDEGGHYQFNGPEFHQNGKLIGKSLRAGENTAITTGASQEMVLEEFLETRSTLPWNLTGTVRTKEFSHLGKLDLAGELTTASFKGHGKIQPTGKLKSEQSRFIADLINLGEIDTQVLQADARLATHGNVRVRRTARVMGKFTIGAEGSFTGYTGEQLTLSLHDAADIAGKVDVDHLDAKAMHLSGFGQLLAAQKATVDGGLTIAADAQVQLKALELSGDTKIINHGTLGVDGIDTALGILHITNSGVACIDNAQVLPKASEQSPENLARIATMVGPVTWENYLYSSLRTDHEFENQNGTQAKLSASKYLKLSNALSQKQPHVSDYKIDPAVANLNGLVVKQRASSHKKAFIERYEKEVVRSTTEGSIDEQAELQQYLKQFEPHYSQIFTARTRYAQSLHPAMGAALVVESSSIPAVKLQLLNQTPGELTLKSGKFEFIGNNTLINDGTLIQDSAYTLWLTGSPGDFNQGVWQVKGSLGLLGYSGQHVGKLEVENTLHVDTNMDGLKVLNGLKKVTAKRLIINAPEVNHTSLAEEILPWNLELHLAKDFSSLGLLRMGGLQLFCKSFKSNGKLFTDGLNVLCEKVQVGLSGIVFGKKGVQIDADSFAIDSKQGIPGAVAPKILYTRSGSGFNSEGPVVLKVKDHLDNNFGTIHGSSYTIT